MKDISVAVPTLNSAATLEKTLLSLLGQEGCSADIIVADSGSTDGTLEICKKLGVRTVYAEPGNMYRAINAALRGCDTGWLAYLNADDWLYPDGLARLIAHGEAGGAGVVYGNCDYTDYACRPLYSFFSAKPGQLLRIFRAGVMGFAQHAAIFRKELYARQNGFDETYSLSADADFYFRALLGGARFSRLGGKAVACFRLHAGQQTNTKFEAMEKEKRDIRDKLAPGPVTFSDKAAVLRWRLGNLSNYLVRAARMSALTGRAGLGNSNVGRDKA